jgi:putative molybdopterin biosynthesis protein
LISLRQGISKITGCHIFDPDTGLFNSPLIKRILPDRSIKIITLAHREQGLILAPGNPKHITGLDTVARKDIVIMNRNPGSGTRIWFDRKLDDLGIKPDEVIGYTQQVSSHSAVARSIKHGLADVGLGLNAAASQENLDFIPLFIERYDLVIPESSIHDMTINTMLDFLTSAEYRQAISALKGYDSTKTGEAHEV